MQPNGTGKGYVATIVSGLIGALVGGAIGVTTAGLVASDSLGGLGVALIWLLLLSSLGAGAGVAVGLGSRGHARQWLTAVLAAPATFLVGFGALVILARIDLAFFGGWVSALIGWGLELVVVTVALAVVRWAALSVRVGA